ncbi:hypothetical protein HUK80_03190 [Flavobacterium sp. MAH-1]|uniref:Uncharacterized protein n=1 Tax=Flavobacterium agri TaxID=2743471 RepID=A0A7Y8XZR0_9FLAO|nr:hypothetical protein [Flavobacterium agri]NUY79887.1 hypothetical protein [Flavobacterium agri]NYA69912.1 hypothetical protein [Flavobacterium agri]
MNLLRKTINLHTELLEIRNKQLAENQILERVSEILNENAVRRAEILKAIESGDGVSENHLEFDLLETGRIFHLDQIRKICIDYRLRFLESKYFKGGIPEEAITQISMLENDHATNLGGFRIVAPTKTFQLKNFNDPLLFAPIGNGYYYLVHKWGNDLDSWRKIWVWPFRNLITFTLLTIAISFLVTWVTPETNLSKSVPMAGTIIFLFAFKSVFAVTMYSFFMLGKKFNCSIWNSEYFND